MLREVNKLVGQGLQEDDCYPAGSRIAVEGRDYVGPWELVNEGEAVSVMPMNLLKKKDIS